ncbi:hypothetical protein PP178_05785 [Zeaxanthinibacter sp. PT1]|uniref:hypothetical protein n=1 Tax=Zeaxanthinibacter TaxID=561554 RepID=UPI002348FA6C|nr:hypothetical protein [Zeaxanthinibacter sp. PT1]MDC6351056.1 hypothetical protein [Zeaxanthinibacter sp. PT1]
MASKFLQFTVLILVSSTAIISCKADVEEFSELEKSEIRKAIGRKVQDGVIATRDKDIDTYMAQLPEDLLIHDEDGKVISREQQREYTLRSWEIIDTTLFIAVLIDSIRFSGRDSVIVYNSQRWERLMLQRDGLTLDTILTTQRHRETWKKNNKGWFGYTIEELGGEIFINGQPYSE